MATRGHLRPPVSGLAERSEHVTCGRAAHAFIILAILFILMIVCAAFLMPLPVEPPTSFRNQAGTSFIGFVPPNS